MLGHAIQQSTTSGGGLGFDNPDNLEQSDSQYTRMAELVNEELKRFFRPEFLNRLDEVIVFQQLTKQDLSQIADIMLAQLCARTKEQNFTLNITPRAKDLLIDEGFDPIYGARPLRRAIMKLLEDKLANTVLSEVIEPDSLVLLDVNDQKELTIIVDRSELPIINTVSS